MDKIHWQNFGLVIFDEVHWAGSTRNKQVMDYLKERINYGIGCSATPIRKSLQNQKNIQELYGKNYNIMYELSYKEAWEHKVILKIDTVMFPIYEENPDRKEKKNVHDNYIYDINKETKQAIISTINNYLNVSYRKKVIMFFRNRLSLLQWYSYFNDNDTFNDMGYHMSITYDNSSYDNDDDTEEEKKTTNKEVNKMIEELKINKTDIDNGITNFKSSDNNAILMVVNRANEGFNDPPVDICVNLDFTQNSNMLVTLQRMGRAQRLCGDKKKGYYICPVLSNNNEEFKDNMAHVIYNYIDATTKNRVNTRPGESYISKEVMTYIIDSFITEGKFDYTNEELMQRILRFEKERDMTLDRFIEILKIYNIYDISSYNSHRSTNEKFIDEGVPKSPDEIQGFAWRLLRTDNYYDEKEIIEVLQKLYDENMLELNDIICEEEKLQYLHEKDNKIPNITLWSYYTLDRSNFNFIFK